MPTSTNTQSLATWLTQSAERLRRHDVPSPRPDAELLMASVLDVSRSEVGRQAALGRHLSAEHAEAYRALVDERARRVPLQHLTGYVDFAGLRLRVGPGVFVPRVETELIVDRVESMLRSWTQVPEPFVVDLCTGSGAIALALKHRLPHARVYAVEKDPSAHAWAALNRDQARLDVDVHLADARQALHHLDGGVDVVTCNPPYVPNGAVPIDPEVRDYDPEVALYGRSADGLALPRQMMTRAAQLLRPGGLLALEHAEGQGARVVAELNDSGCWSKAWDEHDLTGRPRTAYALRSGLSLDGAQDEDHKRDDEQDSDDGPNK
ncbi:MAG: peptide chain release factor N(5)-glutamine methyltransferase [Ornithinimicrobium sp.]